jgi:hypothetical protein
MKLRQENCKFQDSLGYLARPCLKKKKRKEGSKEGKEREKESSLVRCNRKIKVFKYLRYNGIYFWLA